MGIAHSNEVKCVSVMDGDARGSSPSMFMCVCGIAAIPAFLLLSISQPMKADHPDFVRRSQEEMLNCKRWSDIRQRTL